MGEMKLHIPHVPPKFILIGALVAILAAGVGGGIYQYQKMLNELTALKAATQPTSVSAAEEAKKLAAKVTKLVELPTNEVPTIVTVNDVNQLKGQPFFALAQNGDKVLIYTKAGRAVLFRPTTGKVIEITTISIGPPTGQASPSAALKATMTVTLLNGTNTVGLTKKYQEELKVKAPDLTVTDRENAKTSDYKKTILVDLSGLHRQQAQELAGALEIELSQLPEGEPKPLTDFLIIVGEDKK